MKKNSETELASRPVFGVHASKVALEDKSISIEKVWIGMSQILTPALREIIALAKARDLLIQRVPKKKLDYVTYRANHQQVVLFVSPVHFVDLDMVVPTLFEKGKAPCILALEGISDVRNLGAILRSAECGGIDAVVITRKNSAPLSGETIKCSSGAALLMPIAKVRSMSECLTTLRDSGFAIIGCSEKATDTIYDMDLKLPTVLVLGSEQNGMSNDTKKVLTSHAKVPMYGETSSLNVSAAATTIIFEMMRQRNHNSN